ncbi:MAG: DUF1549 domain-containing protein [Pirellulales bacterium]
MAQPHAQLPVAFPELTAAPVPSAHLTATLAGRRVGLSQRPVRQHRSPYLNTARRPHLSGELNDKSRLVGRLVGTAAVVLMAFATAAADEDSTADAAGAPVEATAISTGTPDGNEVTARVDELIRRGWDDFAVRPASEATDGEWCRRVYLDVLGRIPTVAETNRFVDSRDVDKRTALVDWMLTSDEGLAQYARNWSTIWTNLLIGRTGGMDRRSLASRTGLEQFTRRAFATNMPYDRFVTELVAANGMNKPGEEDYNGAVSFLLDHLADNAIQATAKTSQIFLGVQVQCTQCHDHPFNEWKQDQFWGMNAFFRQTRPLRTREGQEIVRVRLEDQDFPGESGSPDQADIFFELRNGISRIAYPTFIDGTTIDPSGYVDEVNRRDELARLMTTSSYLPRAIVNRTWEHFLGYGFTRPVDDMGPHNAPSHPELLDYLADRFVASGFDLQQLIRWIVLSETYSLSSRGDNKDSADNPSAGTLPLFSRFYLRQMRPEELYESLRVVTDPAAATGSLGIAGNAAQERERWLRQFAIALGTDDDEETTTFNGTIPQTLMMMNGALTTNACRCAPGTLLHTIATSGASDRDKLDELYIAALSRTPTKGEVDAARAIWASRRGNTQQAYEDIYWALLNSSEFLLNH